MNIKNYLINNERLMKEWNWDKNINIDPSSLTSGSPKKVWWVCAKGHEWEASINNRNKNRGCPYCSNKKILIGYNDLKSQYPELMKEWNYSKNTINPEDVSYGSDYKVWWICPKGHEWQTNIYFRTHNKYGCPICAKETQTSFPEQTIYYYLNLLFKDVYNRFKIENQEIDIFIKELNIGIEYDGYFYHNLELSIDKENNKNRILKKININLYRIKETDKETSVNLKNNILYLPRKFNDNDFENGLKLLLEELNVIIDDNFINLERDRNLIGNSYINNIKQNSLKEKNPKLASEWNYSKNGNLLPEMFMVNSHKKVWWICSKGHEWQAIIANRNDKNRDCPYCCNQKVNEGENSVLITHPEITKFWDYDNNDISPNHISHGADRLINFKCEKGHQFSCLLYSFTKTMKCPVCQNRKVLKGYNDLTTTHPNLCNEWNYNKNKGLLPTQFTYGSGKKVWWRCLKGHEWKSTIQSRTNGSTCPQCRKDKIK